MSTALIPIITVAGLQAAFNADNTGLSARISQVALGNQGYTVAVDSNGLATQTSLQSQQQVVDIADGSAVTAQQVDMSFIVDGTSSYWVKELGFYLDDGTLFAVWSDPANALAYKSNTVPLIIGLELVLAAVPANSITVQDTGTPLQLIMAREYAIQSAAILQLQTEQCKQRLELNALNQTG